MQNKKTAQESTVTSILNDEGLVNAEDKKQIQSDLQELSLCSSGRSLAFLITTSSVSCT